MSDLKDRYERVLGYIGNRESFTTGDLGWLTMFRDYCVDSPRSDPEDQRLNTEIIADLNGIIAHLTGETAMSTTPTPPSFPTLPQDLQEELDFMNRASREADPDDEQRYFNQQKSVFFDRGFYLWWDDNEDKADGPAYRAMSLEELHFTDAARYNAQHGGHA